jgi:hypothetical protein
MTSASAASNTNSPPVEGKRVGSFFPAVVRLIFYCSLVVCTGYVGYSSRHEGSLVPAAVPSPTAAPGPVAASPQLRIMFIGDSITEGITANSHRKFRAPRDGSCSFRFHYLSRVLEWLDKTSNASRCLYSVGPSTGVMGSSFPPIFCLEPVRRFALTTASFEAGAEENSLFQSRRLFGRHAAHFGGRIQNLFITDPQGFAALRMRIYKKWFRRPYLSGDSSWTTERPMEQQEQSISAPPPGMPRIQAWMRTYKPHVVFVSIGTNDLYVTSSALHLVRTLYPTLLRAILCRGQATVELTSLMGDCCFPQQDASGPAVVTLSTLLWRVAMDVEPVNHLLRRIKSCKQATDGLSCKECVEGTLSAEAQHLLTTESSSLHEKSFVEGTMQLQSSSQVYCDTRVRILDAGNGTIISNATAEGIHSAPHLYDGVHPSPLGEMLLAQQYWRESVRERVWETAVASIPDSLH